MTSDPPSARESSHDIPINELSGSSVHGPVIQSRSISGGIEIHYHAAAATVVIPRQLPGVTSHFTGREAEIAELNRLLDVSVTSVSAVMISSLGGMAGIGKTSLAVYWSRLNADRFPHGQLFVNLRGFEPIGVPMEPGEALRGFISAFGIRPENIPLELPEQISLYRSLLDGQRVLVVLDNAISTDQVRPLLPGSPSCLVIVTSRHQLAALVASDGAKPLTVKLLSEEEGIGLLSRYLGARQVENNMESAVTLVRLCGRLPLALSIVAARAAIYNCSLDSLVADLRAEQDRLYTLDLHDGERTSVNAVFSWSYRSLTPDSARFFRLLGLNPGPDISLAGAASLTGLSIPRAHGLLDSLGHCNLIDEFTPGRYRMHDLLRVFALDRTMREDDEGSRREAIRRLLDFLLIAATAADRILSPNRDRITVPPPSPGVVSLRFSAYEEAVGWLESEHTSLIETLRRAGQSGLDTHVWQLAWTLGVYYDRRGHATDRARTGELALAAADRLGDLEAQALIRTSIGSAYSRLGQFDEATRELSRALAILRDLGAEVHEANALIALAIVDEERDHYSEAKVHLATALNLHRKHDNRAGEAHALENMGWCHAHLGEHRQALDTCNAALTRFRELRDRDGEADTLDSLGYVHAGIGEYEQALVHYRAALKLWQEMGNRYDEADVLTRVGDSQAALGDHASARNSWQLALTIFDDLAQPDAELLRAKLAESP
ncbi:MULTISPECIES: ATP-binding protein [unclassified Streptosporangium]|uniref:ATP-binding protein n=1 Tax=unclassified Streptosporangium TaxID=2632669 RepID=UPI002E2A3551|nr:MULTISPECIES: tetratricopeptide repeat protein [unclassified Streptosporangium]